MQREFQLGSREECLTACAERIAGTLAAGIAKRGQATFVTAGGRTAMQMLPLLARQTLNWASVTVVLADERWVDKDDRESNERLVYSSLINCVSADTKFIGLKTSDETPLDGLGSCTLRLSFLQHRPFDAVFLGMGEDGHIASLFPHGDWVSGNPKTPCIPVAAPVEPSQRMSLTPQRLLWTQLIVLPLLGGVKRAIYQKARVQGPVEEYPVRLILQQTKTPVEVFMAD